MKHFTFGLVFLFLAFGNSQAQLTEAGPSRPSNFKKEYLKKRKLNNAKKVGCPTDTLVFAQYNSTSDQFLLIDPSASTAQLGMGQYFEIDDTVWVHGFHFYAYAYSPNTQLECRIYYANQNNREPAGVPIASKTYYLGTGINWLPFMQQTVYFNSPVRMVKDFVLTVENQSSVNIVVASNSYADKDGGGKSFGSLKFGNGWTTSINVGTIPFDADFYIEPFVSYNLTPDFEPADESCLGNGEIFKFQNTTPHVLNPQFSPEAIDSTLEDNFLWDYGDGSAIDTAVNGENNYLNITSYFVNLEANFNSWYGSCSDDTTKLVDESDLQAIFQSKATDLLVEFKDQSVGAETWDWDFGDGSNGSQTRNPTHVFPGYGFYTIQLQVTNKGCTASTSIRINLENEYIGIEEVNEILDLNISPNPASNYLNVTINSAANQDIDWVISDMQGKHLMKGLLQNELRLDLNGLQPGVYFMQFNDGRNVVSKRFIVQ